MKVKKDTTPKIKKTDFAKIEKKWQKKWGEGKVFEVKEDSKKKKFYVLEMFPYPSSSGLHMGHAFNYTIGDIYARFKRMQGYNVLYPMGFDSFGLPAENAAIKAKSHPKKFTEEAIKNYIKQMKSLGLSYDWNRIIETHKPDYYKWDQWIFLKMFEKGLAYRKKAPVNWCPECNTVLANEQVIGGKCWRHEDTNVQVKHLEQWFFKTTEYAEELLQGLDKLDDWPEIIKTLQRNWISKSEGTNVIFKINNEDWNVFTTRVDTLMGVTFLVISAQHHRLIEIVAKDKKKDVEKFLEKLKSTKQEDIDQLEKEGVFTGSYAIHPITKEKIPVWIGNFVLAEYGGGMVMAVPAHDKRDYEFAKKYKIPIMVVIQDENKRVDEKNLGEAYEDYGILVNSGNFNGLTSDEAKEHISVYLKEKGLGEKAVNYKLRDWLISRQRFWGTPIPIIYCDKCGIIPVPEKELPVVLPENIKFEGIENPLKNNDKFVNCKCPECGGKGKRETDTMDTFVNSSWYYLRYADPRNNKEIFSQKKVDYWNPIDLYIGGKEHACLHLIYIRHYTKFLRDLGLLKFDEPAKRLFNQGILAGIDGERMSKSRGNVVLPETISEKYGIDVARLFLMSIASPDKDILWNDYGAEGSSKFIKKIMDYFDNVKVGKSGGIIEHKINKAIKKITENIEYMNYNLAIIHLRELFESFNEELAKEDLEKFIKLLCVFCPHISEELWEKLGKKSFVSLEKWPEYDEKKINEKFDIAEKVLEQTVSDIMNILKIIKEKQNKEILPNLVTPQSGISNRHSRTKGDTINGNVYKEGKKVYLYVIPKELENYNSDEISKRVGLDVKIFAVNDARKYDPENKSGKAKLGKPAIFVE